MDMSTVVIKKKKLVLLIRNAFLRDRIHGSWEEF